MKKHQFLLKWGSPYAGGEDPQVLVGEKNDLSISINEFCTDCDLWQIDNPYPFEMINSLTDGLGSQILIGSHSIRYNNGYYRIISEYKNDKELIISLSNMIIYSKYYGKCYYLKKDCRFILEVDLVGI